MNGFFILELTNIVGGMVCLGFMFFSSLCQQTSSYTNYDSL